MHGERVLRACMLGLVLVNLVFVQLTEAAPIAWLAPLYVLIKIHEKRGTLQRQWDPGRINDDARTDFENGNANAGQ